MAQIKFSSPDRKVVVSQREYWVDTHRAAGGEIAQASRATSINRMGPGNARGPCTFAKELSCNYKAEQLDHTSGVLRSERQTYEWLQ